MLKYEKTSFISLSLSLPSLSLSLIKLQKIIHQEEEIKFKKGLPGPRMMVKAIIFATTLDQMPS